MKNSLILSLFVLLLAALPAHTGAATPDKAYFLNPADLPPQLLPPPPSEGSKAGKQEAAAVEQAQRHIDKNDKAAMANEQHIALEDMTQLLGSGFTRDRLPKTFALLDDVFSDTRQIVEADKNFWHTRRPYLVDPRVKLLIDPIDTSPAYPSGHTALTRVIAEVLGMLYPDKLDMLRQRAEDIAWHRVEAGVHYPSDLEGGRLLAMLIVGGLLQNDDFHDRLLAAQLEIAHGR